MKTVMASKTVDELASDWWREYSKDKDLQKWETVDPVHAFVAGWAAAMDQVLGIQDAANSLAKDLLEQAVDIVLEANLEKTKSENT